ncbi:MAG: hypothetical protein ABW221_17715 [Vicinamibacteria bacterium]
MKKLTASLLPLLLLGVQGCKKEPPPPPPTTTMATLPPTTQPAVVSVGTVTLGNAIDADKKITTAVDTFTPKETIYASVDTTGTGPAKLRALWSFVRGEKVAKVDETTIEINPTGPATSEFHVSKPSGWPKGDYKVEIFLNDAAVPSQTKTFKVG